MDQKPQRQFPPVSKSRRMLILALVAPAAVISAATVVAWRLRKPLPETPASWMLELIVGAIVMCSFHIMWQFCVWAIVYTPEAETRLIKRLSQMAFWGITLVLMTVVSLVVFYLTVPS